MSALDEMRRVVEGAAHIGTRDLMARALAEVESLVESSAVALHAETERGNALAVRVAELEAVIADAYGIANREIPRDPVRNLVKIVSGLVADYTQTVSEGDEDFRRVEELTKERDTLRAELAGAQSQAAAAKREAAVAADDVRMHNECVLGDAGVDIDDGLDEAIVRVIRQRDEARAQLAARDAEVPGLSTTPGYTMDDVAKIEAARGRPYVKLRETVRQKLDLWDMLDRTRIWFETGGGPRHRADWVAEMRGMLERINCRDEALAAAGNETKEVES